MALTLSQKRYYAWEFLRRNPEYQSFWNDLSVAKQEASRKHQRMNSRTRLRGQSINSQKIVREFNIRALERWCLTKIYDWQEHLTSAQLEKLFAPIRPVTEFYSAPWVGDPRLYLAIDPHGSLEEIKQQVLARLKKQKVTLQLPLKERKKPRAIDLEYYLGILKCYRDHLSGPHAENRALLNYGYTKGWSKLEKALQAKGFTDADQELLSHGTLVAALNLRSGSPFCFLG